MIGSGTVEIAAKKKATAIEVFRDATFTLHKWHSNAPELEAASDQLDQDITYAKQQLGGTDTRETKLLGLAWDREQDTLSITLKSDRSETTKRGVLSHLASIYDPLGVASPATLVGKQLFRDICDSKLPWDTQLPGPILERWEEWRRILTDNLTVPRAFVPFHEPILQSGLHAFGDASAKGVSAAVYAVVHQSQGTTQQLVCAKSRLAKKNLTIPRLELIAGHMAANLVTNVQEALAIPDATVHCWLDSTAALYWIKGQGEYRQFVANRVHKIQQHGQITWRHVPTADNPADLGSRGGAADNCLWLQGPPWLSDPSKAPADTVLQPCPETRAEMKVSRELFAATVHTPDAMDQLLEAHTLPRVLRVGAWIWRFIHNCRHPDAKVTGPVNTTEVLKQKAWWIKRVQDDAAASKHYQEDRLQLNLQPNDQQILECRGSIQGEYPVYLPDTHLYTKKFVKQEHLRTLHGGVGLTMTSVRKHHWVPRLRRLAKQSIRACNGCRRFQARAVATPPPGNLPVDRTQGTHPFQVIGVDYAGPLKYKKRGKAEGKAYIALYACSLSRALYLDLMSSLETQEFLLSLKKLIARKGRPQKIYSDNGTTFIGASRWLKDVMSDEKVNQLLAEHQIVWQFNLSRAPWWGGQFERMVGLVKNSLNKTIGNGFLTWKELEEVLLDVEVTLNSRPLSYVEDDVQLPILTPASLLYPQSNVLPELGPHHIADYDLRKRAKHLLRCKEAMWKRWSREYLRGLRERHNLNHPGKPFTLAVGDVVIVKSEDKNRGRWPLGIVVELFAGRE